MEHGRNRVFINPNFNKKTINNIPQRQVTAMHVNPNFCNYSQNVQSMSNTKIYINPNFVRANIVNNQTHYTNRTASAYTAYRRPSPLVDTSNTFTASAPVLNIHGSQSSVQTKVATVQPFQSNSRYAFVRQKKVDESQCTISKPQTNTIKISKYKSIKITDIKKTLNTVPAAEKSLPFKVSKDHKSMIRTGNEKTIAKTQRNRYKFVRPAINTGKTQLKRQSSLTKKISSSRTITKSYGVYKKNNIPCPQYRKFGKCLRKLHGKCEFLHDKKHVSICRKFLNGVCHNDACLLSHELSDKKMPTCYFYLKGMCTKEVCPYLHVKLNEKVKICPDFIKGYCEKGDKCLNRHVTKTSNTHVKRRHSSTKVTPQKLMKYRLEKSKVKNNVFITQKGKIKPKLDQQQPQEKNDSGQRYYIEPVQKPSTSEGFEIIKPTRCKLGILPSFIQL